MCMFGKGIKGIIAGPRIPGTKLPDQAIVDKVLGNKIDDKNVSEEDKQRNQLITGFDNSGKSILFGGNN